jgi:hypothetical protein
MCGSWQGATWLPWTSESVEHNAYGVQVQIMQVQGKAAKYGYGCVNAYRPGIDYYWPQDICAPAGSAATGTIANGGSISAESMVNNDSGNTQKMWGWEYAFVCTVGDIHRER